MTEISIRVLKWYAHHGRKLPWRGQPDPYTVWVSEIMLQQTRVETVIPYFRRWMKQFPSISALAMATEQEVLSAWEGLGYYSRARNIYKSANLIIDNFGGELPCSLEELLQLPGVGRYTAGAIASIAFNQNIATLDGNLKRIFARLFNINEPVESPAGKKIIWGLAEECLPKGRSGDYHQGLMDLGATVCLPRNPVCSLCPLGELCKARALGIQEERPVMKPKAKVPHYIVTAAVLIKNGKVLIAKRPSRGLLGGLWEFPGGKVEKDETLEASLIREISEELETQIHVGSAFGVFEHAYTHFRITLHAFLCELTGGEPKAVEADELVWADPKNLGDYPMGKVDRQIAKKLVGV